MSDLDVPLPPSRRDGPLIGPAGLRSGWRVVAFLLLDILVFVSLYSIPFFHRRPEFRNGSGPEPVILAKTLDCAAVLLTTLIFAWLERRTLRDYGLPLREAFGGRFWLGGLLGFAGVAFFIGVLSLTGHAAVGPRLLHGTAALRFGALWGVAFLLIATGEELLMRGYLLATLTRGIGFWPAAVATSLFFAFVHLGNPNETAFGLFQVFVFGMVAALMLRRSGSLWLPIGYHALWDWGQSYVFGVGDSGIMVGGTLFRTKLVGPTLWTGGLVGPEGSVLVFLILMATAVLVVVSWPAPAPSAETNAMGVVLVPVEGAEPCQDEISSS
jgi:membrane protease YdiL (CAAX protease family)